MALKDVTIPAEIVTLGGADIRLRALSLPEIAKLVQVHGSTFSKSWAALGPLVDASRPTQAQAAVFALIGECTDLIADVIAIAAGEPQSRGVAAALPIEMQFRAAVTIIRLTLGSADPSSILADFHEAVAAGARIATQH